MTAEFLVTGATGFVGGALVRRLSAEGRTVVCPVRREAAWLQQLPGITPIVTRLHDPEALAADLEGHRPRWIVHLAAAGVRVDDRSPRALIEGNVATVAALLQVATRWPVERFVHVGSCAEYGQVGADPVDEATILAPTSAYGGAKAAASVLALGLAAQTAVPLTILRLFGTFGIGEAPQRLLPYVLESLSRGQPCRLSPGDQVRDLTWIDDVVDALCRVVQVDSAAGQVLHVCSGRGTTVREVCELAADLLGAPRTLLHFGALPHRDDEPRVLVGNPAKMHAMTGWQARTDLDTAILLMRDSARNPEANHAVV
jgi:UDP-glucose 4-epimerase